MVPYRVGGSFAFADIPAPSTKRLGYVYDVTDDFTTTEDFSGGAGVDYEAGTNIVLVLSGGALKYDVLQSPPGEGGASSGVVEFPSLASFPNAGEAGTIYVALDTGRIYRWSDDSYTELSESVTLGETEGTAYRGDRGAAAYAHGVIGKGGAFERGLYKIATNSEGHVTEASSVEASDLVALGVATESYVNEQLGVIEDGSY